MDQKNKPWEMTAYLLHLASIAAKRLSEKCLIHPCKHNVFLNTSAIKKSFASLSQDNEGHFHLKLQKTLVLTKTWSKIIFYPSFYISASLFLYYYLLSFYITESTYCLRHKCRKYLGIHTKEKKRNQNSGTKWQYDLMHSKL